MRLWKIFKGDDMVVPRVGRKIHYIMEEDGTCCAADLLGFESGDVDDNSTLVVDLLAYDPDDGTGTFASGIVLSGFNGPDFPNWHYSNHNPDLVPAG